MSEDDAPGWSPYRDAGRTTWRCPRCEDGLAGAERAGVHFDECSRCAGIFAPNPSLRAALGSEAIVTELRGSLPRGETEWSAGGRMYVKCPVCETLMNRKQYATGARVVVDWCKPHGIWFDAGELPRVLDFLADGGAALAAKRDAERAHEAEQREKLRKLGERLDEPRDVGWRTMDKDMFVWLRELLWHL